MVAAEVDTNKQSKAQITDDERLHWIALSARKIITASGKVSLTANTDKVFVHRRLMQNPTSNI